MTNILKQPYTNEQYAEFAHNANLNMLRIEVNNNAAYALYEYEKLEDGKIIDLREDADYKKQKRLKEIEQELIEAENICTQQLDTPIPFINQHLYKPKWAEETYLGLLSAGQLMSALFPIKIWDATELEENMVEMQMADLIQLTSYLALKSQVFFDERKAKKSALLKEKQELLDNTF